MNPDIDLKGSQHYHDAVESLAEAERTGSELQALLAIGYSLTGLLAHVVERDAEAAEHPDWMLELR